MLGQLEFVGHFASAVGKRWGRGAIVNDHHSIDGHRLVVTVEGGRKREEGEEGGEEGEVGTVIFFGGTSQSSILSFLAIVQCARSIATDWLSKKKQVEI